eukprot:snap_masked-scaffold_23-processed-gene-5.17-mRNA-1 protein AED:0.32 eAED:0.33 QI:0/-1/0/1/-1/1/1/0/541
MGIYLKYLLSFIKYYIKFGLIHSCYKLLHLLVRNLRRIWAWKHLPGYNGDWLSKNHRKNFYRLNDYYHERTTKYPGAPLVKTNDGPRIALICNNEESIKWLLKDEFESFTKTRGEGSLVLYLLREFIGKNGLFTLAHGKHYSKSQHELWLRQRKVVAKIFTKSNFENFMYKVFLEKSMKMAKVLETRTEEFVDLQDMFFKFTMDSIEEIFFGNEINSIEGEMSFFGKNFDTAHQQLVPILFENVQFALLEMVVPFPFDQILFNISRSFTKRQKIFTKSIQNLDSHVYKFINQAKVDPSMKDRTDLIANFLNANLHFGGKPMSDKILRDILLNVTIAGRDTTACTLSWMFYELSIHPEEQNKLFEEIRKKLESNENKEGLFLPKITDLTAENMPYLNAVIHETLRLHPPVASNFKVSTRDSYYLDGTYIPKNTKIYYYTYSLNRNPELYPDPEKFDPERWIPFKEPSMYEFTAFQAGPRFCLGKDMAKLEIMVLSCILLQKFQFKLKPGEEIFYAILLTMSIANDYKRTSHKLLLEVSQRTD